MYYRHRTRAIPDNREMSEEEEKGVEERRERRERGHERKHTTSNRRWGKRNGYEKGEF